MKWNQNMSNLRNVLAGLYWNSDDMTRIIVDVGLKPAYVDFMNKKAVNSWHNILKAAMDQGKVQDIIAEARKEYPTNQSLILAERQQLLTIELPEINDDEWNGPKDSGQLEAILGAESTLLPICFLEEGFNLSRSVARIEKANGNRGTGFLIENNLLITNHHVLPSMEEAQSARIQFNFQQTIQGCSASVDEYHCIPSEGFATSLSEKDGGDDWTVVRVSGDPNKEWGAIKLAPVTPKEGERAIIIQHPGGGEKQIALYHNVIVAVTEKRIQYLTDTLEGSSGSPVFGHTWDNDWQVIAIHHKGGQYEPRSKRNRWRNQGVHINVVIEGLKESGLYPA